MESFENEEYTNEPESSPEEQDLSAHEPAADSTYRTSGAGRRESPYANSPYEMNHHPQYQSHPAQTPPADHPKKAKKGRKPIWKTVIACLLTVALVAAGCSITAVTVNRRWEARDQALTEKLDLLQKQLESTSSAKGTLVPTDGSAMTPSQLYASCVDSVVAISATVQTTGIYGNTSTGSSAGSGFILTEDGYIVTNYHVVEDSTALKVTTHDGTEYEATLVGKDSTNDVAVLKVEAEGLPAVTLGSSHDLVIGDMVAAIGNPLGKLSATQTIGYVSGINREVATGGVTTISMIQTDAAINPGNSGGPLLDSAGRLIGINTAIYSPSGASAGIGFAVPVDTVMRVVPQLIKTGKYIRPALGIEVDEQLNTRLQALTGSKGVFVLRVTPGSAAHRAGLVGVEVTAGGIVPGDRVISIDGIAVDDVTTLQARLDDKNVGDVVVLLVERAGKTREMLVELQPGV